MTATFDLAGIWHRLAGVTSLKFAARSDNSTTGWNGSGQGSVLVEEIDPRTMLFHESGLWTPKGGNALAFTNVFRWTFRSQQRSIRLEHLRFGKDRPVYLFDLVPVGEAVWESSEPHVCREDRYTAAMDFCGNSIRLHWTVKGPTLDETIRYSYD